MALTKQGNIVCDYCGKFISRAALEKGTASHYLLTPDSALTVEEYESHHIVCLPGQISNDINREN